jgi:hypothetical protein
MTARVRKSRSAPFVRFTFTDGAIADVPLEEVARRERERDAALAKLTDEPAISEPARLRAEERDRRADAAIVERAQQSAGNQKARAVRQANKVASDQESIVARELAAFRDRQKRARKNRDPRPSELLRACQSGGWDKATVSNISRILQRILKREREAKGR